MSTIDTSNVGPIIDRPLPPQEPFGVAKPGIASVNPQSGIVTLDDFSLQQEDSVDLHHLSLREILGLPLSIPDYQRIYCWEELSVSCLLNDLYNHLESDRNQIKYRKGTVIMHNHNGQFDVIDGQQRLVTLAIFMRRLGVSTKLLKEHFPAKKFQNRNFYFPKRYIYSKLFVPLPHN